MSDRVTHPVKPNEVKKGDLMALIYYVRVREVEQNGEKLKVFDLDGETEITVTGKELIERSLSANQFSEEIKVGKTAAAEILVGSPNKPISVCFDKQDGTERTLNGRLVRPEPLLGRSMMEDLDAFDKKNNLRQVDHRTIKWLVVDGVKYVVK